MKKLIKWIKDLRCRHDATLTITNLDGMYKEIYNADSIVVCKNCGKLLKRNQLSDTNVVNFQPKGDE